MKKRFTLDRPNGMALGVCAGLGRYFGVDPTLVRIGAVLVTLLGAFPWTLVAYGVAAWMGKARSPANSLGEDGYAIRGSTHDYKQATSDLDRRLAEVDTYVAGSNSRLAKEIEELR
jgi:phage shock protein C